MTFTMKDWLGISYLKEDEPEWSQERLDYWKKEYCANGIHLLDEVMSLDFHYLYCDACGVEKPIDDFLLTQSKKVV